MCRPAFVGPVRAEDASAPAALQKYPYSRLPCVAVPRLEEITHDAGRAALADQESLVAGVRQRTGTLLAAHALVASFLGATTIRARGLDSLGWLALAALVAGLIVAAFLLAPWKLKFAIDARQLYDELYEEASPKPTATRSAGSRLRATVIRGSER